MDTGKTLGELKHLFDIRFEAEKFDPVIRAMPKAQPSEFVVEGDADGLLYLAIQRSKRAETNRQKKVFEESLARGKFYV